MTAAAPCCPFGRARTLENFVTRLRRLTARAEVRDRRSDERAEAVASRSMLLMFSARLVASATKCKSYSEQAMYYRSTYRQV